MNAATASLINIALSPPVCAPTGCCSPSFAPETHATVPSKFHSPSISHPTARLSIAPAWPSLGPPYCFLLPASCSLCPRAPHLQLEVFRQTSPSGFRPIVVAETCEDLRWNGFDVSRSCRFCLFGSIVYCSWRSTLSSRDGFSMSRLCAGQPHQT